MIAYDFLKGMTTMPVLLLILLLALAGCAPSSMVVDDREYRLAERDAAELLEQMPNYSPQLQAVDGSARAQVSRPGESERVTVYFSSSREASLLRIRNQLGIEGGRVLSREDSVTLYNRIEETVHRFSKEVAAHHYLSGITALNLVEILNPEILPGQTTRVFENDDQYLLVMADGTRYFLNKAGLILERVEYPALTPEAFSIFIFQHHASINGYRLPRRIQILSSDEKSNIFLLIQSLEVNPSELNFDMGMPEDITIERI